MVDELATAASVISLHPCCHDAVNADRFVPGGPGAVPHARHRGHCLGAVLIALSASASAQQPQPLLAPAEYAIDQWTTEHGLPQNSVNAIVQSPDGYLWVGTFGGLARFDGSRFSLVERRDSTGRHIDRVLSLALAGDGSLWIGTEAGLLHRRDGGYARYTTADGLPDDEIRALHVDDAGVVWIGTTTGGLGWLAHGAFGQLTEVAGVELGYVSSIVEDAAHTLWISTGAGRLLRIPERNPDDAVWTAPVEGPAEMQLQARDGAYWLGLPDGTTRVQDGAARRFSVPGGSVMVEGDASGYWIGTPDDGLFHLRLEADTALVQRYALPDARLSFRVRAAIVDREGNVWVGTDADGLLRARRNLFTTYTREHGLSHNVATAVFEDRSGTMWVGTNCGGVNAIDAERRTITTYNPRSRRDPNGDPCIFALAQDSGGQVWQGSYGGGVSRLPRRAGTPRRLMAGLPDTVVRALFTARDGTLWFGTRSGGLATVVDGRVDTTFTTADGLAHDGVNTIHQARDGALWIGTIGGLSRFADGRLTSWTAADGLSSAHVRAIHEDADGTLWIGTYGGGLNRFRAGVFTPITRQDGLGDDVVSAILVDDADNFWMSGNRGIFRVARDELNGFADGRLGRVHSVLYGRTDGLRNPETNGGIQPAAWKDGRGHLWFPTVEGVAVVDPARATATAPPPGVALEEVVVNGVVQSPGAEIVAGPARPNLEFRYNALSLSAPEHVSFQYRLENFDTDWVEAGTRRVAYYPQLPAGTYRFTVRAADREGAWGEAGTALRLRVVPPLWGTWWFRIVAALTLLGLAAGALHKRAVRSRQDRAAREEFARRLIESQEHERRRLAGELHDGLGQELLIVRNRALLALHADGDVHPRVREQLHQIRDLVTGSLGSIRALAHNLTPHQLDHLGITTALETMVDAVAETASIEMDARIEPIDGLLPVDSGINLYRIVQEALNNIVHHAGARAASVHVRRENAAVRITITDDGCGFQLQRDRRGQPTGGFGLSGMAQRTRIIGGRIDVRSSPGSGTAIELHVPITDPAATHAAAAPATDGGG